MKQEITLKQMCELMKEINKSKNYEAYFKAGKPIIESRFIYFNDNKTDKNINRKVYI